MQYAVPDFFTALTRAAPLRYRVIQKLCAPTHNDKWVAYKFLVYILKLNYKQRKFGKFYRKNIT